MAIGSFQDWAGSQNIDLNMWNSYNPEEQAGILNSYKNLGGNLVDENNSQWVSGLNNMDTLRGGLGIGQLGLGVMSYLDQKGLYDKQKNLMNQQIEQNKFLIDQAKQRQKDIASAFGGGGLAASSANK